MAYWAIGRSLDAVSRAADASLNFGVYAAEGEQVGYARVVTDGVTLGWLCDVYIARHVRGRGIGTVLSKVSVDAIRPLGLKRFMLSTADAHEVYTKIGFVSVPDPTEVDGARTRCLVPGLLERLTFAGSRGGWIARMSFVAVESIRLLERAARRAGPGREEVGDPEAAPERVGPDEAIDDQVFSGDPADHQGCPRGMPTAAIGGIDERRGGLGPPTTIPESVEASPCIPREECPVKHRGAAERAATAPPQGSSRRTGTTRCPAGVA